VSTVSAIDDVPAALLAGGLATRLQPITREIPKALVDVAGRPFIDHQLELLRRNGIRRVVLCLGYRGDQVEAHLGDGSSLGMQLRYSYDGPTLLGTGGALRHAAPHLGDVFWVVYGDSYTDIDFRAVLGHFLARDALALMTVFPNDDRWDRSNVLFRQGELLRYDKRAPTAEMTHIDYGVALLRRGALDLIPAGQPYDLADLYRSLVDQGRMMGYEVTRRFYEIGGPAGLAETREHFEEARQAMSHTTAFLDETREILNRLDVTVIDRMVSRLVALRSLGGRLFVLGVGGSAGNASHAVNDFRKICGIEAYTPTDNVSELTARTNDDGWESVFSTWLRVSRLGNRDMVLVLSVGGGDLERNVSTNLVRALQYAKEVGATVLGVVGRDGGYTSQVADACLIIPTVNPRTVTPHAEAFQALVWHLMVSHPDLQAAEMKWESTR
jgi:D-sedoheptulose 7-phosphate isomerase